MHELSIVEALIEQVGRELRRAGQKGRVKRLEVQIGRLSGVHADSFRFAFDLLAPGTVADGAQLSITEPGAVSCCRSCGQRREIEELVIECPACGSSEISIEKGRELRLESIEIDD